jgi:hypothetical protein
MLAVPFLLVSCGDDSKGSSSQSTTGAAGAAANTIEITLSDDGCEPRSISAQAGGSPLFAEELGKYFHLPFSDLETVERILDKDLLYHKCEQRKIPIPRTFYLREQGAEQIASEIAFPCIVKPALQREFGILGGSPSRECTWCSSNRQQVSGRTQSLS